MLLPFGTVYDPFIGRGLDALTYAAYTESKFIFAGTPSGITLSPEGGAHQSLITPSIGMEMPNLVYYEPTFAQELEWIFLAGLRNLLDRKRGQILYLRLSTRPVPQNLFPADRQRLPSGWSACAGTSCGADIDSWITGPPPDTLPARTSSTSSPAG